MKKIFLCLFGVITILTNCISTLAYAGEIEKNFYEKLKDRNKYDSDISEIRNIEPRVLGRIATVQIAKSFEFLRLYSLYGDKPHLYENYMQALKKEFGQCQDKINWDKYCPDKDEIKRLEKFKADWLDMICTMVEKLGHFDAKKEVSFQMKNQIGQEGKEIENYFHRMFSSKKFFDVFQITDKAMRILLDLLGDKYVEYFSNSHEISSWENSKKNELGSFIMIEEGLYIDEVVKGGILDQRGFKSGDRVLAIDGKEITAEYMRNQETFSKFFGSLEKNSSRVCKLKRGNQILTLPFIEKNDCTNQNPVVIPTQIGSMGVVKITSFVIDTAKEFENALKQLNKGSIKNLIIDLRENLGGRDLELTLNQLLGKNKKILSKVYNKGIKKDEWTVGSSDQDMQIPIVLLINKHKQVLQK